MYALLSKEAEAALEKDKRDREQRLGYPFAPLTKKEK
jgi:hypothetical protein